MATTSAAEPGPTPAEPHPAQAGHGQLAGGSPDDRTALIRWPRPTGPGDPPPADAAPLGSSRSDSGAVDPAGPHSGGHASSVPRPAQLLDAVIAPAGITVTPGDAPAVITVGVFNLSKVVDGYTIDVADQPEFLRVDQAELRLLPETDATARLSVGLSRTPLVPAGEYPLTVRVRSSSHPGVSFTGPVTLTVGVIEGPLTLAMEPSLIRVRDGARAEFKLVVENLAGNTAVLLELAGSDPEGLVRFAFSPPVVTVPPGGRATATVRLTAPPPEPGQEISRQLMVTATHGAREITASGTLIQARTAQDVRLTLEPSLINVRNTATAQVRLIAENPTGATPIRLTLRGSDPEGAVRFTFAPPVLTVPPGGAAITGLTLQAPEPEPGQDVSRILTITASDGQKSFTATGTLNQTTSPLALSVWLEPSLIRVRDSPIGYTRVVADNRGNPRPLRLLLAGSDAERIVSFAFNPVTLDVAAGEINAAYLTVQAPPPGEGLETSRTITVLASTVSTPTVSAGPGSRKVEATGTFVQASSAPAISALSLRLEPAVVRSRDSADGVLEVVADNRDGTAQVRAHLEGSDPEGVVDFVFEPQLLDIPPGGWALARVRLRAPRPERGQQVTRGFTVTASEERRNVAATGSYVQNSSDRRPLIRMVLTVLGTLMMVAGVFLPWTTRPGEFTGIQWSLLRFAEFTKLDLAQLNIRKDVLEGIDAAFQSAGLVVLLLAAVTLFGLTGTKGRLIRAGSALVFVFLVAFLLAFMVRADSIGVAFGAVLVGLGAVSAFAGGLVLRR